MQYRIIDLFAGIGGTRLGFEKAGCISVFSSEWDEASKKTYAAFFSEIPHGDITKTETKAAIKPFDILVAGFPCQPFSSIGKREGFTHPTQGTLFHDVVEIIKKHKPAAFLLENVKGLKSHDGGNTYRVIRATLDKISPSLGYWVNDKVLNAADYGTPQKRERIYLVGFRKDLVSASTEFEAGTQIGFSFASLPKSPPVDLTPHLERGVNDRPISAHLQKVYIHKLDDGRPQILNPRSKTPQIANTLCASYHKIQRLTGIFVKDGNTGLRLLSENECRAIMGFPKIGEVVASRTFSAVPVSRTQMYRQFGNSVAVPVVEKIAKQMVATLERLGVNPNG